MVAGTDLAAEDWGGAALTKLGDMDLGRLASDDAEEEGAADDGAACTGAAYSRVSAFFLLFLFFKRLANLNLRKTGNNNVSAQSNYCRATLLFFEIHLRMATLVPGCHGANLKAIK